MGALYRSVLTHRGFLANLAILATTFVGLFAWVSGAPVVMQGIVYGLNPIVFGVTFAIAAAGFMTGSYLAARIAGPRAATVRSSCCQRRVGPTCHLPRLLDEGAVLRVVR